MTYEKNIWKIENRYDKYLLLDIKKIISEEKGQVTSDEMIQYLYEQNEDKYYYAVYPDDAKEHGKLTVDKLMEIIYRYGHIVHGIDVYKSGWDEPHGRVFKLRNFAE